MEPRLNYSEVAPEGVEGLSNLEGYVRKSGLEHSLLELVKLRASQLNGCAYCIDMHTKDARTNGESEQRLYGVSAWHEAPF
ncbi:MAG: carboxymuconolactone decarboxylase family protein, partial [Chloroflexi bacterium]|nr:carboxymuconolactone decarboxylase family protein [Chloroflexota bacterium]